MTDGVVAAILFAAFLHAGWNALIKRRDRDPLSATVAIAAGAALISLCLLPFVPPPAAASWPFLAASAVPQIAYYLLIAKVYRGSDLGLAYPVMRGTAPFFVAAANAILFGEALSWMGFLGVGCICGGVLLIASGRFRRPDAARAVTTAIGIALVIASYTVLDGLGVRRSASPAGYTLWVFLLTGMGLAGWILIRRRTQILQSLRVDFWTGLGGGGASLLSYGIALWAMTKAPVAAVAALRETSILFAALMSMILLREKMTWERAAAAALLTAGAVAIRLS
ncbi:MAG TPA: EamA family transporter [Rhizomicrobium sp.]|jgi:drug/metabolite transporter (DMT)-like permease|nr:EamA family transporter [Rhizomicrobium sp.]